jgi:hypothetical protein
MNWQEIILYGIWLMVYIVAGKIIVDDLYIGKKRIKGLLWVFWCPFVIGITILAVTKHFVYSLRNKN